MSHPRTNGATTAGLHGKPEVYKPRFSSITASEYGGAYINVQLPGRDQPTTIEKRVFDLFFKKPELPEAANSYGTPKE